MKKLILLISCLIISFNVFSQEIVLTFNPIGAASTIDSITATNMETGMSITVPEVDTLRLNSIPTINVILENSKENSFVYPNPFHRNTTLYFTLKQEDKIKLLLINSIGQVVSTTNHRLSAGTHKFEISGKSAGMYYVTAISKSFRKSFKIICVGDRENENNIQYSGASGTIVKEKSGFAKSGDLIHFELTSGKYKTKITDKPTESKTYDVEFMECEDKDSKTYQVVQIGNQWWMAENLAYLPLVNPSTNVSYTEKCYYVYDYQSTVVNEAKATENYNKFGVLYNWPAAMNSCPGGWHLPSDDEWKKLEKSIGMSNIEVNKIELRGTNEGTILKATNEFYPKANGFDGNGTDDYGFSGLPGGYVFYTGNDGFHHLHMFGYWWSSTEEKGDDSAWRRYIGYDRVRINRWRYPFSMAISVRCVRD